MGCVIWGARCWQQRCGRAVIGRCGHDRLSDSRPGIHPRLLQLLAMDSRPRACRAGYRIWHSSLPAQTLSAGGIGRFSRCCSACSNLAVYWGDIVAIGSACAIARQVTSAANSPVQTGRQHLAPARSSLFCAWQTGPGLLNLADSHGEAPVMEARFAAINASG